METKTLGLKAKDSLIKMAKFIDQRLLSYWDEELRRGFGYNTKQKEMVEKMLLHAKDHNLRSAKRLRGSFVAYGYRLGGAEPDEGVWRAAESVELVHTALLMHDDFMDEDKVRRGGQTSHEYFADGDKHYGESMAVCLGDVVLCLGFERLMGSGVDGDRLQKAMNLYMRAITNTAFGQAYDASLAKLKDLTEESVLSLHRAKTGIYTYENPILIGAILGGVEERHFPVLKSYASDGGVAFQLQDDILGVFGDEEKTGKSADSDLLQGKVTLLIVKALEMGNDQQRTEILAVWGKSKAESEAIKKAKEAIRESGSYEYSVQKAKTLAQKAAEKIAELKNEELDGAAVEYFEGIARYMVDREV